MDIWTSNAFVSFFKIEIDGKEILINMGEISEIHNMHSKGAVIILKNGNEYQTSYDFEKLIKGLNIT